MLRRTGVDDPHRRSAYTYAYATLGEIFAWIIGWDLILEYAVSNMAVAVGFSAYLNDLLDGVFHVHLPTAIAKSRDRDRAAFQRELFQSDGAGDVAGADMGPGARDSRERRSQQCDGR